MATHSHGLLAPPAAISERATFDLFAREHRSFHTVTDARVFLPHRMPAMFETATAGTGAARTLRITSELKVAGGTLHETSVLGADGILAARTITRRLIDDQGRTSRIEEADFGLPPFALPPHGYPDSTIPTLVRWQPLDGGARSCLVWLTDRFISRLYVEPVGHRRTIDVPAGQFEVQEVIFYPDFRDYVNLPAALVRLTRPFAPKYHCWVEVAQPHRLIRFEGPFGPPGAPEIVFELRHFEV